MAITSDSVRSGGRRCTADERFDRLCRPCPTCGAVGLRIVYGFPSGPLMAAARRGKLIAGGCTHLGPTHRCPNGHEWASPDVTVDRRD